MTYLLNFAYAVVLAVALPWLLYRRYATGRYRQGLAERLWGQVPIREGNAPCVWLHAVSVGEVNLLETLIRELHRQRPDWTCVVSTSTDTGYALAKKKYPQLTVFFCPLDFSWAVRRALKRIRPQWLVLAELELWPNLIRAAGESGARVAVVNGRLSESSHRGYRRLRPLAASMLRRLDLVAAQDETYAARFRDLGARPEAVRVTGSLKFDGAEADRENPATQRLRTLAGFDADTKLFLAGSTQDPEEALALDAYRRLAPTHPELRLALVPRHPERFEAVAELLSASSLPWQRRSRLEADGPDPKTRVLLVDTVGELKAWWGAAEIAFVGGSMGSRGGQNMIEPAAYGSAVSFGPNTRNFRDIVAAMLAAEAAVVVADGEALYAFVRRCLESPAEAAALGRRAQALVRAGQGATRRTVDLLLAFETFEHISCVPQPAAA